MSARWLLDVAALVQASRGVAQSHAALRAQQIAVHLQTSSLVAAAKSQTSGYNARPQPVPTLKPSALPADTGQQHPPVADDNKGLGARDRKEEGIQQDHHYEASQGNSSLDPKPDSSLSVRQEKGPRSPLPDGTLTSPASGVSPGPATKDNQFSADRARLAQRQAESQIPSQVAKGPGVGEVLGNDLRLHQDGDVFHDPSKTTGPTYSSLPRVKMPKATSNAHGDSPNVTTTDTNPDVFYTPTVGNAVDAEAQKSDISHSQTPAADITEDTYSQLFHTPRVQQMISGQNRRRENPYLSSQVKMQEKQAWPPKDHTSPALAVRDEEVESLARDISNAAATEEPAQSAAVGEEKIPFRMRESRVPSSRFGRLWQYAGLGASMTMGAAAESFRRISGAPSQPGGSVMLSPSNLERLVSKLSRMRGAALKLGQMLSFQDSKLLPPTIHQVLQRVQDSADYMPASQRNQVLEDNLGVNWRDLFTSFEEQPLAAASIGQVHGAVLKATGEPVVVKIQYPGVANSISSDLNNLSVLLTASRLLPKGLYLEKTIANARTELAWECDYVREAEAAKKFQTFLADEPETFVVPRIFDEASGPQVLTMQRMGGKGVTKVQNLSQEQKDWIGTQLLRLCLREITEFKYMQTDPNWTNFLFNSQTRKLELLDFGASRGFSDKFIVPYAKILQAASREDREACRELSIELGYLTGMESKAMLDAHIASIITLAEPFKENSPDIYDFRDQTITDRVREFIPVMLRERLAPPPEETYSLHRKLSGAFLLLARLGARVPCKELFTNAMRTFESRRNTG